MSSQSLFQAMVECSQDLRCQYFYDNKGSGTDFYRCLGQPYKETWFHSIIYIKGGVHIVPKYKQNRRIFCWKLYRPLNRKLELLFEYCILKSLDSDGNTNDGVAFLKRPIDGCPAETIDGYTTCFCEEHCSWSDCFLSNPPEQCLTNPYFSWTWISARNKWVAQGGQYIVVEFLYILTNVNWNVVYRVEIAFKHSMKI